jgi:hypothetical protein
VALEPGTGVPEGCVRSGVLDHSWISAEDDVALDAHLVIDLWSDEPNDLEELVFVVERSAVVADMTLERWHAYQAAHDAWLEEYLASLDVEVRAGRTTLLDTKVKTPPPPPPRAEVQPPRPSRHARWISGYWLYEDATFHWIAGLWDVPEEDVQRELTVQAPTPPPAAPPHDAHDEPAEPPPTRSLRLDRGCVAHSARRAAHVAAPHLERQRRQGDLRPRRLAGARAPRTMS